MNEKISHPSSDGEIMKERNTSSFGNQAPQLLLPQKILTAVAGKSWKFGRFMPGGDGASYYGKHKSPRHDGYMPIEFAQHRQYSSGDEIRHIDWKIFARKEKFFIKQFRSETSITAYLMIDASRSMGYPYFVPPSDTAHNEKSDTIPAPYDRSGARIRTGDNKFFYACQTAALSAYVLINQGDAVGLFVAGGKYSHFEEGRLVVPPSGGWVHFERAIVPSLVMGDSREEYSRSTGGVLRPMEVFKKFLNDDSKNLKKRSLVIFISDLMSPRDEMAAAIKLLTSSGHTLCVVIHVLHPDEIELPLELRAQDASGGSLISYDFIDSENMGEKDSQPVVIEVTPDIAEEYKRRVAAEISFYKSLEASSGGRMFYHTFMTDVPIEKNFLKLLE